MTSIIRYFNPLEWSIWAISIITMTVFFFLFDQTQYLYLIGSWIGSTALIFLSKGHPFGQVLVIIFAVFYGIIAYSFSYYGEMITYLFMTAPIALLSLITWMKNPYEGKMSEVKINVIGQKEYQLLALLSLVVTFLFYFILAYFDTNYLWLSTLSILTSFVAAYLTMRRSIYYALAYAVNDVVLIILWVLASIKEPAYMALVICFISFLVHDIYGFISWKKRYIQQTI
jgi:nicotinamide mononucleotide transporter PnuC